VNINGVVNALLAKEHVTARSHTGHRSCYPGALRLSPTMPRQLYGNPSNSADFVRRFVDIFRALSPFSSPPGCGLRQVHGGDEHTFVSERDSRAPSAPLANELQEQ